jgi:4-hydroxymandelate oxidase
MRTTEEDLAASQDGVDRLPTLLDVEQAARAALPQDVWDFLAEGAGAEETLADNRAAFARWRFRPRVMSGIRLPSLATSFLGIDLSMPVLTAPVGADGLFHADGHRAIARANAAHGLVSLVAEASTFSQEAIRAAAPSAARIMQLHPTGTVDAFLERVQRAADAGYELLCVTLDCPTAGFRERGRRSGIMLDESVIGGNYGEGEDRNTFWGLLERGERVWTWEQFAELCARSPLPCIAKGVLTREDAAAAVDAGAVAVLVSNHGGRQLDGAPASLDQLPEVAEAVGGRVPILLDSGVRRGSDVLKAVALGATAVVIGRLMVYGLAAGGQAGVERVHQLLRDEMITTMALLGCETLAELGPERIQRAA